MITQDQPLQELAARLRAAPWVAMDTEADSLHAYPEKVCLIQVSLPGADVLVDPLATLDLRPLWAAIAGHELLMHGSDYDLRLLSRSYGFAPAAVFDTMLAARLLGYPAFGLGNLVQQHLGIVLEKGPQKANWAIRPLSERMETYARNDSRHLKAIEEILRRELEQQGRLSWHVEMCRRLVAQCTAPDEPDPDEVWRVKGSGRLPRRALAVLRAVWHWREHEARAANRPPFFILSPDAMTGIAHAAAEARSFQSFLPRRFSPRRYAGLRAAIAKALALPAAEWPAHAVRAAHPRLTAAQRRTLAHLEQKRNAHAEQLRLDPSLIAPRATLLALATDGDNARRALMDWQQQLLFG